MADELTIRTYGSAVDARRALLAAHFRPGFPTAEGAIPWHRPERGQIFYIVMRPGEVVWRIITS